MIALLGRKNNIIDGVEDYCNCLAQALIECDCQLKLVSMPWAEVGWLKALRWLWKESVQWQEKWVLIQYTALNWSKKGFPLELVLVLLVLRQRNVRLGIVFHDIIAYPGHRLRDRIRRAVQYAVMRYAVRVVESSIFTVEPKRLSWLGQWATHPKVMLIPVGSNIPRRYVGKETHDGFRTVVVFGIDSGKMQQKEVIDITQTLRRVTGVVGPVRLTVLGRGSIEAEPLLRKELNGSEVSLEVLGLLPGHRVSEVLASADVQLFIHGGVYSNRTTAIAGIVHGLPIVGYTCELTDFPITTAGVRLVRVYDNESLAEALITVLSDNELRAKLCKQSREAAQRYFSWDTIAEQLLRALHKETIVEK